MPFIKIYFKEREGIDKPKIAKTMRAVMHENIKTPLDDGPVKFCFQGENKKQSNVCF